MICENCGNEHDGSYGSGRFCSKHCRGAFVAKNNHNGCKSNKEWTCKWCGLKFNSRKKMYDHVHQMHGSFSGSVWNKGLTKETSIIISNSSKSIREGMARAIKNGLKIGRGKTPEREALRRKHISEVMKNNPRAGGVRPGSGRGKHGWYRGYWCDSSWELAMVIFWLEHNIEFHRCNETFDYVLNGKHHTYHPDFQLASGEIVEVKGRETTKEWEAKLSQFPEDRKLVVIGKSQIVPYIDYAIRKYGKNYIDLYEKQNFNGEVA